MNLRNEGERKHVKEFLTFTNNRLKIKSAEVLEKDFYLTIILSEMKNENLIFKGGTCLAKVYLKYHRFSEDLDFTWKKQEVFKGKTMKQIRKVCSELINEIGREIEAISKKYEFAFEFEKDKRKKLNNLIKPSSFSENERKYFKDFLDFHRISPAYSIYDINEIVCEKIRSILTRRQINRRCAGLN